MAAYNFARRLKTLNGLTPYEYTAKIWTSEPDRLIVDPIHQMPGPNTWVSPHMAIRFIAVSSNGSNEPTASLDSRLLQC